MENLATIGRERIDMASLASMMHITYKSLMRMKYRMLHKNGYYSWEGFFADYILTEFEKELL